MNDANFSNVEIFELQAVEGTNFFALYATKTTGYLSANSNTTNSILTETNVTAAGQWAISFDDAGKLSIIAQGGKTTYLQYNNNSPRFVCYGTTEKPGSQKAPAIYKSVQVTVDENACQHPEWTETSRTEATCTEDGEVSYVCATENCGVTKTETLEKTGHNYDDGVITASPKCDTPGEKTYTCTNENCPEKTKTEVVEATGHSYVGGYCSVCTEPEPQDAKYEKVTSNLEDWSGKYLIVYEAGNVAFDGSLSTLDAASNNQAVTISDNTITTSKEIYFTITAVDGGYSIQSASDFYIGRTSDGNGMNANKSTAYTNTISLADDGSVTIVGSGGAYLRYNANSGETRFRYYKSATYAIQKAIALYKLVEESSETPNPAPTLDEAIAKFESTKTFTSLKTNTYDGEGNATDVSLRFGMRQFDTATYTTLRNAGATFGVKLSLNGNEVSRDESDTWFPEADGSGYSFSIVIDNLSSDRWDKEITAQVYIVIDGAKHYMQPATYSVNSLVKALGATINGSIIAPNTPAVLQAVMNTEVA